MVGTMYKRRPKGLGVGLRAPSQKPSVQPPSDSSQSSVGSALQDIQNRPSSTSSDGTTILSQDFFDKIPPASTPKKGTENIPDSDPVDEGMDTDELLNVFKSPGKPPRSPEPRAKKVKRDHGKSKEQYKEMHSKQILSYMEDIVVTAGFFLQQDDSPNILNEDQAIFINNVSKAMKSGPVDKNVSIFMKDFEKYHEDRKLLFKALSPTQTGEDCNIARGHTQDSLVHLLLQVDCLEPKLMEYLLEKMGEIAMDEDSSDSDVSTVTWIRMILQSFRFLNKISDPGKMNTQLFDIIHACDNPVVQREIIVCLPDIIGDMDHFNAASELSKLLREKPALTTAVLDALTNLSLQSETRVEVQQSLLRSLRRAPVEYLPSMVKFLVSVSSVDEANEVINGLRLELFPSVIPALSQTRTQNAKPADIASSKKLCFNMIRYGLLVSKVLADTWLKNIENISNPGGMKALDVVVLLIMYSIAANTTRKTKLETLFRTKIVKGVLKIAVMEDVFESFLLIVEDNFASLMKIASVLLKCPEVVVTEFASDLYCNCFSHVSGQWCKWIVTELLMYVGAGDAMHTRSALQILNQLAETQLSKLKNFAVLLTSLLNKLNEIGLNEVRMLMDTLSRIAYSSVSDDVNTDCYALQDELNMLARKQLASSQVSTVRNGVVSTVMIIKHIASVPNSEENEWPDRASEIDVPLTDRAKRAFPLLDLVMASTRLNPEAQGLFFDQLSKLIFRTKNLDRVLLYRVSVAMKNNLQESFLISVPDFSRKENTFEYALQFSLEENEEDGIALDLTSLVIKDHEKRIPVDSVLFPLLILPSLVRLLRALESEDLSEIDALLVCPVAMPTLETLDEFLNLSPDDQTVVMNSLFYCVNWYREIINAFSCFIRKENGDKVVMRLRLIIWLQNQISRCLPKMIIPDYCPPMAHFHTAVKSPVTSADKGKKKGAKKGGKKRKSKKLDKTAASTSKANENTVLSGCTQNKDNAADETEDQPEVEKLADLSVYSNFFRELDVDVWLLLTYKLTINQTPPSNGNFSPELGPNELLFLLEDFVFKVEHCLAAVKKFSHLKTANTVPIGIDSISSIPAVSIIKNCLRLLPNLCGHRNTILEYSKNLLLVNDHILDNRGMFMPESKNIKQCLGLIFRALTAIFSWNGFKSQQHHELFKTGLVRLAQDSDATEASSDMTVDELAAECCKYLVSIEEHILHLASAQSLVSFYQALAKHLNEETTNEALGKICLKFLKRRWYDLDGTEEQGSIYNKVIEAFLYNYLSMTEDQLSLLEEFISLVEAEAADLSSKDSRLESFPTISKTNFPVLMKALCKSIESAIRQGLDSADSDVEKLEVWTKATNILEKVVKLVKTFDGRQNLVAFVSSSLGILRLFNSQAVPVCSVMFRTKNAEVSQALKRFQTLTRYVQTVCNHVKVASDTALAKKLPQIRMALETVVLQVKNLVVLNGCTDAFFLGSMRNKNLKGEEIPTQSTVADEDSDSNQGGDANSDDEGDASGNEDNNSSSDKSDDESAMEEDRTYSSSH